MSYVNLKSARRSKQAKSFVNANAEDASTPAELMNTTETVNTTHDAHLILVPLQGLYQALPNTLELKHSSQSGRGVYAKDPCTSGSTLISTKPIISVLSSSCLELYCSSCCTPSPDSGLKRCTRCHTVRYCNSTCQSNDWVLHRHECAALQKWVATAPSAEFAVPNDAIRGLGRILWARQRAGSGSDYAREIDLMQSHRTSLPPSSFDSHTHLAHAFVRYLGVDSPQELAEWGLASAGDLVDFISRFMTNTFTLTTFSLAPIGICISPTAALINHSCEPNAVLVFPRISRDPASDEPLMQLVAIRDIQPGEEILTAYIDTTLPREIRRQELKDTYNFVCNCTLCTRIVDVDPRASMFCPKSCGGTCPVPTEEQPLTRCIQCRAVVASTDAVLDALRVGQEALTKATNQQLKDPDRALHLTSHMLPILVSSGLTPSSHPLLALTRLHQQLLISTLSESLTQETLDETIRVAAKAYTGVSAILPAGHPVCGLAAAELGKLLAVDEPTPRDVSDTTGPPQFPPSGVSRLKMAYTTLIRAKEELKIGFGKTNGGGRVSIELRDILVRLEKELGVWTVGVKNAVEDARGLKIGAQKS